MIRHYLREYDYELQWSNCVGSYRIATELYSERLNHEIWKAYGVPSSAIIAQNELPGRNRLAKKKVETI